MPRHPNNTPYDNHMSVFKADPQRERRHGHPTTNRPRYPPQPGSGQAHEPGYPGSGDIHNGGWSASGAQYNASLPASGGGRSAPSGANDYGHFFGRSWHVQVFSNNQNIATMPISCLHEQLPSFSCVCGVRVVITMDMRNMQYQPPYGFLWVFTHEAGQWQQGHSYSNGASSGTCPICNSQLQLIGPM